MVARGLFERALGLQWPWRVKRTEFDAAERRLPLIFTAQLLGEFSRQAGDVTQRAHERGNGHDTG